MSNQIEVSGLEPLSPHNAALYEAGKTLLVESVEVGRDFCKSMIGVATGAIPVYLALVGLVVGEKFRPGFYEGLLLALAPAAFLVAAVVFAFGYFPSTSVFSLDVPEEIERARATTISRRKKLALVGFGTLVLAIVLSIAGLFYGLRLNRH
jgi:hypothetical protein